MKIYIYKIKHNRALSKYFDTDEKHLNWHCKHVFNLCNKNLDYFNEIDLKEIHHPLLIEDHHFDTFVAEFQSSLNIEI